MVSGDCNIRSLVLRRQWCNSTPLRIGKPSPSPSTDSLVRRHLRYHVRHRPSDRRRRNGEAKYLRIGVGAQGKEQLEAESLTETQGWPSNADLDALHVTSVVVRLRIRTHCRRLRQGMPPRTPIRTTRLFRLDSGAVPVVLPPDEENPNDAASWGTKSVCEVSFDAFAVN